jgi:hypothetical protein
MKKISLFFIFTFALTLLPKALFATQLGEIKTKANYFGKTECELKEKLLASQIAEQKAPNSNLKSSGIIFQ